MRIKESFGISGSRIVLKSKRAYFIVFKRKAVYNNSKLEMMLDLVRDNALSLKEAAAQVMLTEETFQEK